MPAYRIKISVLRLGPNKDETSLTRYVAMPTISAVADRLESAVLDMPEPGDPDPHDS